MKKIKYDIETYSHIIYGLRQIEVYDENINLMNSFQYHLIFSNKNSSR